MKNTPTLYKTLLFLTIIKTVLGWITTENLVNWFIQIYLWLIRRPDSIQNKKSRYMGSFKIKAQQLPEERLLVWNSAGLMQSKMIWTTWTNLIWFKFQKKYSLELSEKVRGFGDLKRILHLSERLVIFDRVKNKPRSSCLCVGVFQGPNTAVRKD